MALVKFTMPEGENAATATLSANADGENISGSAKITFDEDGLPVQTYVSGEMHKTVTLKGDLQAGKTYYFVIRSGVPFKEGMTISIDGRKYRTSASKPELTPVRNSVMNLTSFTFKEGTPKDLYTAYEHGFDLQIGGKKFDKETYGPATLITSAISAPSNGIYFLNPDVEQPIGSNIEKMAIIGRYADQRSVLTRNGLIYISGTTDADNYLVLANVEYKVSNLGTNKYYMGVNKSDAFENLVYDNIKVELPNAISLATCSNTDNRAFKNVVLVNSDIKIGASAEDATYTGATTTYLIKSDAETTATADKDMLSLTINNNVIYSDGNVKRFRVFSAEKIDVPALTMKNNTFVNCYQYYGYVASLTGAYEINEVRGNLFYVPDFADVAQWYAIVYPKNEQGNTDPYKAVATEKFSDNRAYYGGTTPAKYLRSLYGSGTNSSVALSTAPFTDADIAAGNFALPEGTTYGAKRTGAQTPDTDGDDDSNTGTLEPQTGYDVFLLIGQSNMAGRGEMIEGDELAFDENVFLLDDDGNPVPATNPLNQYSTIRKDLADQKIGPGYGFSKKISKETGRKILLVVNARGGSNMSQWGKGVDSYDYYEDAVARANKAMEYGTLKAILWHQGCSDVSRKDVYMDWLKTFVADLRSDLADVPFVAGELGQWRSYVLPFNEMLHTISDNISNSDWVSSEGGVPIVTETSNGEPDLTDAHFNRESQIVLGERYADKILKMCYGR